MRAAVDIQWVQDPTGPPENRPRVTLRVREPAEAAPEPPKANAKQKRPPPLSKVPKRKPAAPGTKAKKKEGFIVGDDEGVEPEEASGEHDEEEEYKEGVRVPLSSAISVFAN